MKLSNEQAQKLLSEIWGDVELVEADSHDFDIDAVVSQGKDYYKGAIEKEIEPNFDAKFKNSFRSAAQRVFSIPKKDLDGKTWEEMATLIKERSVKPDDTNEWKEKYEAAVADYEAQIEAKETAHVAALASEQQKFVDRDINDAFVALTGKLPRQGGDVAKQARILRDEALREGYEVKMNGKDVELWKDGKKAKTDEAILKLATDVIPLATSTKHIKPSDVKTVEKVEAVAGIVETRAPAANRLPNFTALMDAAVSEQ
jgi:hypothetical protein